MADIFKGLNYTTESNPDGGVCKVRIHFGHRKVIQMGKYGKNTYIYMYDNSEKDGQKEEGRYTLGIGEWTELHNMRTAVEHCNL